MRIERIVDLPRDALLTPGAHANTYQVYRLILLYTEISDEL